LAWRVEFTTEAAKQLRKLDRTVAGRIAAFLSETVSSFPDPRLRGKALTGNLSGLWRYRVGKYRVLCQIDDGQLLVLVVQVDHRRDIYR